MVSPSNQSCSHTKRPQKRGLARRRQLQKAALELLQERDFGAITYQKIAERAGMPLASCYNFYRNKLDLLRQLGDTLTEDYLQVVLTAAQFVELSSWRDGVERHVVRTATYHNRSAAELRLFFGSDVPSSIRTDSIDRERLISDQLRTLLNEQFVFPQLPEIGDIFFRAIEIGRTLLAMDYEANGTLTETGTREAVRAMTGYLSWYLPDVLPAQPNRK